MDYCKIIRLYSKICAYLQLIRTNIYWKFLFSHIGAHSVITGNHRIRGHKNILIGENCWIGDNLRLEAVSYYAGKKYRPYLYIGDNVCINQNFHCTCAEKVIIGDGTSITANCGVFDITHPYKDIEINPRDAEILTSPIKIGMNCLIGMNTVILPGTILGNHVIVGANSTVKGTFPDYCVIAGSPARIIKKYDFETKEWTKA